MNDEHPDAKRRTEPGWFNGIAIALAMMAILIVAFFAGQHYFGGFGSDRDQRVAQDASAPAIGGPFTLIDQTGRTVTEKDFAGKLMLVYFGYTFCPDVCPTTLTTMSQAMTLLGDDADRVVPILVTVDPERDTPEQMQMYASYFHPRLVALTGSPDQIADMAKTYRVYYAKVQEEGVGDDAYVMDHSAITYLMGPDGRYLRHFGHGTTAEDMAEGLREAIAADATS